MGFFMDIINLPFEEPVQIHLNGEIVSLVAYKTAERGNIKLGITAPRSIKVNREEVYRSTQKQQDTEKQD